MEHVRSEPIEGLDYDTEEPEQIMCVDCGEVPVDDDGLRCDDCYTEFLRDCAADLAYRESIGD